MQEFENEKEQKTTAKEKKTKKERKNKKAKNVEEKKVYIYDQQRSFRIDTETFEEINKLRKVAGMTHNAYINKVLMEHVQKNQALIDKIDEQKVLLKF